MTRQAGHVVHVPGTVLAALQVCHPYGGLPKWLTAATPRCATKTSVLGLYLSGEDVDELAELLAITWWECEQDPHDSQPFGRIFAEACGRLLTELPSTD